MSWSFVIWTTPYVWKLWKMQQFFVKFVLIAGKVKGSTVQVLLSMPGFFFFREVPKLTSRRERSNIHELSASEDIFQSNLHDWTNHPVISWPLRSTPTKELNLLLGNTRHFFTFKILWPWEARTEALIDPLGPRNQLDRPNWSKALTASRS